MPDFQAGIFTEGESMKLCTVAKEIGLQVSEEKLHDATYDLALTRAIYEYVTKF